MNKTKILGLAALSVGVFSFYLHSQREPEKAVNWDCMGVLATRTIAAGTEVRFENIEQMPIGRTEEPTQLCGNIKSTFCAVDRNAKRTVQKGEMLMDSDFGMQTPIFGRPRPEYEIY